MRKVKLNTLVLSAVSAAMLAGCATKPPAPPTPPPTPAPTKPAAPPYTWNDTGAKGPSRVVVDLSEQRVYFYRGDVRIGDTRCSTGKKGLARCRLVSLPSIRQWGCVPPELWGAVALIELETYTP